MIEQYKNDYQRAFLLAGLEIKSLTFEGAQNLFVSVMNTHLKVLAAYISRNAEVMKRDFIVTKEENKKSDVIGIVSMGGKTIRLHRRPKDA